MNAAETVDLECERARAEGFHIQKMNATGNEYHVQNWVQARHDACGLNDDRPGRNAYPDFRLVNARVTQGEWLRDILREIEELPPSPVNAPEPDLAVPSVEAACAPRARAWSLNELCRRSGIAQKSLVDIKDARHVPRLETLHALAHILEVSIGDLAATLCEGYEVWADHGSER